MPNPMTDAERLRRPEPKRGGPIRNAATYFRKAASWDVHPDNPLDAQSAAADALQGEDADSEVAHGVRLGYHVIEEHIREGRNTAKRFRTEATDDAETDLGDLLTRALHVYQDAGSLVFDFIEHFAGNPALLSALSRSRRRPSVSAGQGDTQPPQSTGEQAPPAGVELITRRPARAWTQLHPCTTRYTPQAHALYAADPRTRPLTEIRFIPRPDGQGMLLRVEIAQDQPAGTYTGVIVDSETHEPRGTVCVQIDD